MFSYSKFTLNDEENNNFKVKECTSFSVVEINKVYQTFTEKNLQFSFKETDEQLSRHTLKPPIRYVQVNDSPLSIITEAMKTMKIRPLSGQYEGGMKISIEAMDLMAWMKNSHVAGKRVMELGCGFGLPGMLAHKMGAKSVHFQDNDESVLVNITAPSCVLQCYHGNASDFLSYMLLFSFCANPFAFFAGDWSNLEANLAHHSYDVILTSETIYSQDNYEKLHDALKALLEPHKGVVLVAAKTHYLCAGGSIASWMSYVKKRRYFKINIAKISDTSQIITRSVLEMRVNKRSS